MNLEGFHSRVIGKGAPQPPPVAKGSIRLYNMRLCPWAARAAVFINVKGIKCEVINVDLANKPDWFLKLNPTGKVPALELENGKIFIESDLICEYLDTAFPEHPLLLSAPYEKYEQKLISAQLGEVGMACYKLFAAMRDPSLKEEKYKEAKAAMSKAENLLKNEYFSGGYHIGYADILSFPFFKWHQIVAFAKSSPLDPDNFPGEEYPKLTSWWTRTSSLSEIKSAIPADDAFQTFLVTYIAGKSDYDAGL